MNYNEYKDKFNQIIQQINKDINSYTTDMDEYSTSYFNIRTIISVFKECLKNSYEDLVVLQNEVSKEKEK
jgi:hypothetical protein